MSFVAPIRLCHCWSQFYLHVITDGPAGKLVACEKLVFNTLLAPVHMSGGPRFPTHFGQPGKIWVWEL